ERPGQRARPEAGRAGRPARDAGGSVAADGVPAGADRVDGAEDRRGRAVQPVRAVLLVLHREHRGRLDARQLRRVRAEQLPAVGAEHPAGRGPVHDGRVRLRAAAVPRPDGPVLPRPARAAGAVLRLHDPAVLPAAEHGPARLAAGREPGAGVHGAVVRDVLHARLLLRPAHRDRGGRPHRRGVGVADLRPRDAAAGHLRRRRAGGVHLPAELEQLPGAAALPARRRVPAPHHRPLPVPRWSFGRHRAAGRRHPDHGAARRRPVRRDAAAGHAGLPVRSRQGL
ncbi:MAG: ABC transporter, permease protein 2 (cluster 1, maltose/g3p/polyamine/iron), partial [uncultured Corynebacteriales bacterium]